LAGHILVARFSYTRKIYRVLSGNLKELDHCGDPSVYGKIMLI
jgi:hypothetical protein